MNFKKFAIPAVLVSALFIAGCSDDNKKEEIDNETPTIVEETPADENVNEPEEGSEEIDESEVEVDTNTELDAFAIIQTYFDGVNQKDIDMIRTVYNNEVGIQGFESLFSTFDIETNIESFEVISQQGTNWVFSAKVLFEDRDDSDDYHNNISTYEIGVNTETGEIIYLEVVKTQDLQG